MRALTVAPGTPNSARLDEVPDPPVADGAILVRALALGVCGTDREIVSGQYGWAPPGEQRLIIGHESLGVVEEAPAGCGFKTGDYVAGIVRRPDPVPCRACAVGEWDMCDNGKYSERGIKERHGYGAERFRLEPDFTIKIDPQLGALGVLVEPTSIVAKAWDHVERIGARARSFRPRVVAVTGAGPVGLLAALLGRERDLEVHVFDRTTGGSKPALTRELGATYHATLDDLEHLAPDLVMECTGAVPVVRAVLGRTAPGGIVCLTGVTAPGNRSELDLGALNRTMVLGNEVVFGSVNANRDHYAMAAEALARAPKAWLSRLITRRVPMTDFASALQRQSDDIKVVVDFTL